MIDLIILDCGHNFSDTWQKRSPVREDGSRFYEYESNRKIGKLVAAELDKLGIRYEWTIRPDDERDMSLEKRVEIANAYSRGNGIKNTFFISLHSNAMGDDRSWKDDIRGWCIYTSQGQTKSDEYATILFEEASKILPKYDMTLRKDMADGDPDYEYAFYVCRHTLSPAVLIEQLFYTSHIDLAFLDSDEGRKVLCDIIVSSIKRIIELK